MNIIPLWRQYSDEIILKIRKYAKPYRYSLGTVTIMRMTLQQ